MTPRRVTDRTAGPMRPLFGIETEFAVAATATNGERFPQEPLMPLFMDAATTLLPHLPATEGGIFLQNGARLYIDTGSHPEYATPECTDPREAVLYVLAGERILLELASHIERTAPGIARVRVFKTNVDYSGTHSTWGCHESYLHASPPDDLPAHLIPHLVSRIIYTGAGGFNPRSRRLTFMLSPRAAYIEAVHSQHSTSNRALYHAKNETLSCRGYNRLHLLCGESACSHRAMYLKVGTTAMVLALVGAGVAPGNGLALKYPLAALRAVASDPAGKRRLHLSDGRRVSPIDIQFRYLETTEQHLGDPWMPRWAEALCREWRSTLESLQEDFRSLATTLDWTIKSVLYESRIEKLRNRPAASRRAELFELDSRFAQLGREGIFTGLDDTGILSHRLVTAEQVEAAVSRPPQVGRARLRGEAVRRLAGNQNASQCRWQNVFDGDNRQILDLMDPFESVERWRDCPGEAPAARRLLSDLF